MPQGRNITRALARQIGSKVFARQAGRIKALVGKLVKRNGVIMDVREINKGTIVVHVVGEPDKVVSKHNIKQFFAKAVVVVEPPPSERKKENGS